MLFNRNGDALLVMRMDMLRFLFGVALHHQEGGLYQIVLKYNSKSEKSEKADDIGNRG
jgi:hypothetical protein